jgi:hypothetical protein
VQIFILYEIRLLLPTPPHGMWTAQTVYGRPNERLFLAGPLCAAVVTSKVCLLPSQIAFFPFPFAIEVGTIERTYPYRLATAL